MNILKYGNIDKQLTKLFCTVQLIIDTLLSQNNPFAAPQNQRTSTISTTQIMYSHDAIVVAIDENIS